MPVPKLTTALACRVAGINRDRFNEFVAAGAFGCAPSTVPGRTRLFSPDDMIALLLFRELMDEGFDARNAGTIACKVGEAARANPDSRAISYVHGSAFPADNVPAHREWDDVLFSGREIRKVTTYRIGKLREMIARYTDEEAAIIGDSDAE